MLTPGQAHDLDGADVLLPQMRANILLADKAFDADKRVIEPLLSAGKTPITPSMPSRKSPRPYDRELFAARHLIENFCCRLKQFRAIANALRQARYKFPCRCLCRLYPHLAQSRTGLGTCVGWQREVLLACS